MWTVQREDCIAESKSGNYSDISEPQEERNIRDPKRKREKSPEINQNKRSSPPASSIITGRFSNLLTRDLDLLDSSDDDVEPTEERKATKKRSEPTIGRGNKCVGRGGITRKITSRGKSHWEKFKNEV